MKSGNLKTSWNPLGHTGPITGLLYLFNCERVKCHCVLCCLLACQYCHVGPEGKEWTGVFASVLVHASEEGSGMFATNGIYSRVKNVLHKSM